MWIISSTVSSREVRNILSISNSINPVPNPSILGFFHTPHILTKGENKRPQVIDAWSWQILTSANLYFLACVGIRVRDGGLSTHVCVGTLTLVHDSMYLFCWSSSRSLRRADRVSH